MPRPVALLDIDGTLLFNDNSYNEALLNSLKVKGIKDLYLFTDMTFHNHSMPERIDLIKYLKGCGFRVHGVLTPSDITWNQTPAREAKWLHDCIFGGRYKEDLLTTEFKRFILDNKARINTLKKAITGYNPKNNAPGNSFAEAAAEFKRKGNIADGLGARSKIAKLFAELFVELEYKYKYPDLEGKYPHTKGLMLDLFLHHKPNWVSSIIIADDDKDVIKTVKNFKPVNDEMVVPPITMISIPREEAGAEYYTT
jgi:hypothetical protein